MISKASPSPSNGSFTLPTVPAPVKPLEEVVREFPSDTGKKMTMDEFQFIKVLGKGSFGKVNLYLTNAAFRYGRDNSCLGCL